MDVSAPEAELTGEGEHLGPRVGVAEASRVRDEAGHEGRSHGGREISAGGVNDRGQKLGRGRHTTREVTIFEAYGGRIADTPGFASLEAQKLCRIPKDDLQHTFPEFGPYFGQCRFTGCSHRSETGCAVREAVEAGTISKTRYASYLAMYEEASARKEWEK